MLQKPIQSRSHDTTGAFVAVVDDDKSFLQSVGRLLRSVGYAVKTFGSARDFLAVLPESTPQCLVLDIQMPEMTGLELQERLTAQGSNVPIIFVTAYDSPDTRERAHQGGSVGFILKPLDKQALLNAVANAVTCLRS